MKNPNRKEERERFVKTVKLFQENGKRFKFDYLMLMALAFQESQPDQSRRSAAGAIGIMQVLKSTPPDPKCNYVEKTNHNKYLQSGFHHDKHYPVCHDSLENLIF